MHSAGAVETDSGVDLPDTAGQAHEPRRVRWVPSPAQNVRSVPAHFLRRESRQHCTPGAAVAPARQMAYVSGRQLAKCHTRVRLSSRADSNATDTPQRRAPTECARLWH